MVTKNAGRRNQARKERQSAASGRNNRGRAEFFPRWPVEDALRIPRAILEQNAGHATTLPIAASYLRLKDQGAFRAEVSAARMYGLLERPSPGEIEPSDLAKRILKSRDDSARLGGLREAVLRAPVIASVYEHYRGENLPDSRFFSRALTKTFGVPDVLVKEFKSTFHESLQSAGLIENRGKRYRVLDVSQPRHAAHAGAEAPRQPSTKLDPSQTDTCFVVMPFAESFHDHYHQIYVPAIRKAGLKAIRGDDDMFVTGQIMDQVWTGISEAKVLVAELTSRNPNVFYELGIAHSLAKPVVLISSTMEDVPFDVRHLRVNFYDKNEPDWGKKLRKRVADGVLAAVRDPQDALFRSRNGP